MKKLLLTLLLTSCWSVLGAEESTSNPNATKRVDYNSKLTKAIYWCMCASDTHQDAGEFDGLEALRDNASLPKSQLAATIKNHQNYKYTKRNNDEEINKRIARLKKVLQLSDDLFEEPTSEDSKSRE